MTQEKSSSMDKQIITTVRQTMPAVVSVVISKKLEDVEKEFLPSKKGKKKIENHLSIPPEQMEPNGMVQVGGGSGFIVDKSGIILTNKHVIAEPGGVYSIILNNDVRYPAEVLARDPMNDVAILKIIADYPLPILPLGNSDTVELGQTVLAFGNALGMFKNTVSQGIVSGLSRSVSAQSDPMSASQELRGLIQTDAAINPGNSGGPLVDISGAVIGINAAVVSGAQNIGLAIPIKSAERDLSDLKTYGRIKRPLLGVRYLTLTPIISEKMKLPITNGALVTKEHTFDVAVVPGSPSAIAGIREYDILTEWNGKKITVQKSIQDFLEDANVGDTVMITLLRNGKEVKTSITLTERK